MTIYRVNLQQRRIEKLARGKAYRPIGRFKNYLTEYKKDIYLEDSDVFNNERDAAVALARGMLGLAKDRVVHLTKLINEAEGVIEHYAIHDALGIAPVPVPVF